MGGGEQLIQQRSLFTAPLMLHNLQHPLKQKFSLTEKWAAWLKTGSEIGSYQGTVQFVFVLGVFERHSEKIYIDWKKRTTKQENKSKGRNAEVKVEIQKDTVAGKTKKNIQMDVTGAYLSCFYSLQCCLFSCVSASQHCHSPDLGGRVEGFLAPASCSWRGDVRE